MHLPVVMVKHTYLYSYIAIYIILYYYYVYLLNGLFPHKPRMRCICVVRMSRTVDI
jgi:hypothetical protein